jgi:UDP-glucose 4-epimerase
MRALVTGGAGFIGSHIVDELVDAGCTNIVILDNLVQGRRENLVRAMGHGSVRLINGDIRDLALMDEIVSSADIVFHQVALRTAHCAAEPRQAFDIMVKATFDLVEACARNHVQRLVMASSASIYGMAGRFPTQENEPPYANRTLYGAAKLFAEGVLRSYHDMKGLDYVVLRYFSVYGPRMVRHGGHTGMLIRWMEQIDAGEPPIVFSDDDDTMDVVHVRDVARANVLAAVGPATDLAINIASGQEVGLYDLAQRLTYAMGREDLKPEPRARRAINPIQRRFADITAARRLLGFRPVISLDEGLQDLVLWWRRTRGAILAPALALTS